MTTQRDIQVAAIRDYAKHKEILTDELKLLISQANHDLYDGQIDQDDYPGFESACVQIREALQGLGDLWVSHDGCVFDVEPDWSEEDPGDYTHFEARWAKRTIVGIELLGYVA